MEQSHLAMLTKPSINQSRTWIDGVSKVKLDNTAKSKYKRLGCPSLSSDTISKFLLHQAAYKSLSIIKPIPDHPRATTFTQELLINLIDNRFFPTQSSGKLKIIIIKIFYQDEFPAAVSDWDETQIKVILERCRKNLLVLDEALQGPIYVPEILAGLSKDVQALSDPFIDLFN